MERVRESGELAIRLASSCGEAYKKASPTKRKTFNAAFFEKIYLKGGRVFAVEHTELFDLLLSRGSSGGAGSNSEALVGDRGFEPRTSALSERRSNRLS